MKQNVIPYSENNYTVSMLFLRGLHSANIVLIVSNLIINQEANGEWYFSIVDVVCVLTD